MINIYKGGITHTTLLNTCYGNKAAYGANGAGGGGLNARNGAL